MQYFKKRFAVFGFEKVLMGGVWTGGSKNKAKQLFRKLLISYPISKIKGAVQRWTALLFGVEGFRKSKSDCSASKSGEFCLNKFSNRSTRQELLPNLILRGDPIRTKARHNNKSAFVWQKARTTEKRKERNSMLCTVTE